MSTDCLFCGIVARTVPATVVHETDTVLAFADIDPQAPSHLLVIPKEHYPDAATMAAADPRLAGEVLAAAAEAAKAAAIDSTGYRLVFNTGADANQTVFHAHCHVLGGRRMSWPPG
ncbi:HIT family hydrolase, diadenosine tetraphosphate hydrolase [Saccharomonospora marina XMU15]|uniref:HIT family hydrolase, diadenosine tetraphosphate hydrolase n=1 Tax=Saccharomonospora marina XMU15 TaxID=882083 RepID=H5X8M4_9PSEU|nr:histidine triad nucleotide-binding protein [Saccharomonospora marina]EHR51393.1 HIT family hydrolase, diadenosine tetraphosphate hydrolase [Saccharomonospora marina XMU15]